MRASSHPEWFHYVELPRRESKPVRLDRILEKRMETFMRARTTRPFEAHD